MSLVPSLLQAIVRADGEALVMHAGDKPYVVSSTGQIDLANRGLTLDAVSGIVNQMLPAEMQQALNEFGAIQYELPAMPEFPGEHFTVVAARGGDDLWAEIRRHRVLNDDYVPEELFAPAPAAAPAAAPPPIAAAPVQPRAIPQPAAEVLASRQPAAEMKSAAQPAAAAPAPAPRVEQAPPQAAWQARPVPPVAPTPMTNEITEADLAARVDADADLNLPNASHLWPARPPLRPGKEEEGEEIEIDLDSDVEDMPGPMVASPAMSAPVAAPAPIAAEPEAPALPQPVAAPEPLPIAAEMPPVAAPVAIPEPVAEEVPAPVAEPIAEPFPTTIAVEVPQVEEPVELPAPVAEEAPAEPVAEPIAEPFAEPLWEPVAEPLPMAAEMPHVEEPVELPAPVAEAPVEPVAEPISEPIAEPVAEPLPIAAQMPEIEEPVEAAVAEEQRTEPAEEPVAEPRRPIRSRLWAAMEKRRASLSPDAPLVPEEPSVYTPEPQIAASMPPADVVVPPSMMSQPGVVLPISRSPIRSEQPPPYIPDPTLSGLERLLRVSAARGASTLYLSSGSRPSVRVDGELQVLEGEPTHVARDVEALLLTLMPERNHEALRTGAATEWIVDIEGVGRIRCMSFRDHLGPGGVFRMMPTRSISAEQLSLPRQVRALATEPEGLVLVAGPRSGGKRTLMAAFVDMMNRGRRDHIISIEREINIVHERGESFISQREIRGNDDEVLVAARAALREDPDVLVIEDLRTAELMDVALEAAASGRLVVAGFSAHNATAAVDRIIDLYEPEQRHQVQLALANSLRGVVVQTLLRKIGGGRLPAREVLLNTPAVSAAIAEGKTSQLPMAIEGGRRYGMMPLNDALVGLVQNGSVEAKEAYRRSPDRPGFLAALNRQGLDTSFVERLA
jgi:twitching motility protein PilT